MKASHIVTSCVLLLICQSAVAQTTPATPAAVAAKVMQRGDANDIIVPEMRAVRRNDVLSVQSDLYNTTTSNRTVFYRFRWIDAAGNVVGDGESWKQVGLLGQQLLTVKSVALHPSAVDFRLEMNVEKP